MHLHKLNTAAFAVVIGLLASSALAEPARKPKLALLNVQATGTHAATAGTVEGLMVVGLEGGGRIQVTGRSDLVTILGFEQEKQLLGCDSSGCVAELAGALGVDYVAAADVGSLGNVIVLNLKVIDAKKGTAVARASRRVASSAEIPLAVDGMTQEVVAVLLGDGGGSVRRWSLIGGGVVSVGALVAAAVFGSQANAALEGDVAGTEGALTTHSTTERAADRAASLASRANVLLGVGLVAALGTGVGFYLTLPSPDGAAGSGGGVGGSF